MQRGDAKTPDDRDVENPQRCAVRVMEVSEMEANPFTYYQAKGSRVFRLYSLGSSMTMDDHMAELIRDGWTAGSPAAGTGKPWPLAKPCPSITIIYTKP